jgi:hypothetical protein
LGGGEKMNELANYLSGGEYMKLKAEIATAKAEAAAARVAINVFKMKRDNLDLSTISSYTSLSIEEIEQILNS